MRNDARMAFKLPAEQKDAYMAALDEMDIPSASEEFRRHVDRVIQDRWEAIPDELREEIEKLRIKKEGKEESSEARKRIEVTKRVKKMFKQPYSAREIEKDIQSYIRVDELEEKGQRAEYFRGLLEMAYLFRDYDSWDEREELPPDVFAAIDSYAKKYPGEHLDYIEELARKANMETNGYLEDDKMPDQFDVSVVDEGGDGGTHNLICDGGVDVGAARDAAEDDSQTGVETFEVDGEAVEYATRRERIRDVLDGELVGLTVSHRTSGAIYMIATRRVDWGDVDAEDAARDNWSGVDKRMIIWDTDDEDVVVTDRGYWTPEDADTMRAEARQASRASSEIEGQIDADGPLVVDATDEDKLDVDAFLSRSVEVVDEEEDGWTQDHDKMRETPGISPERDWGYYGGPPEEIEIMQQRLEEAGLNPSDHFFKLQFGRKDPIDMVDKSQSPPGRGVAADEVAGNYGVDSLSKDFGLVFVDVDDPDKFPDEELPETFSVSSPHGSDEQRHMVFVCDNKSEIFDGDVWSAQLEWGDLWAGGNRYIVGPGCQLSAYGCNHGEYRVPGSASGRDDNSCGAEDCDGWLGCERCRGGCDRCEDEEGGYYEIQDNVSVKAASAETFSALIPDDDDETEESGNPVSTGAGAPEGMVVADCCGAAYDEDAEGEAFMRAGNRVVCLGGCPDE